MRHHLAGHLARAADSWSEAVPSKEVERGSHVLTKTEIIRRIPAATLRAFLLEALGTCGLPAADAATAADAMLEADLTGCDAHGVFRLPGYVRQLKRGAFNPRPTISVLERGPATALIDGDRGMG